MERVVDDEVGTQYQTLRLTQVVSGPYAETRFLPFFFAR